MKNKKLKPIPDFINEHAEDDFWQEAKLEDYFDFSTFVPIQFPNLKLTTKPITIRIPAGTIDRLKIEAHKLDIPYQALIKQFIAQGLANL